MRNKTKYSKLYNQLMESPFEWSVMMDENRQGDGRFQREVFLCSNKHDLQSFVDKPISVLEVLIGFAMRLEREFITEDPTNPRPDILFWPMICNLGLDKFDNSHYDSDKVYNIVAKWVTREYRQDGKGGIFPLKHPREDQRNVELWRQGTAYLWENF